MGEKTKIEWTDHTFNPWWGCSKVSPACDNCYAETLAHRLGENLWGVMKPRKTFGFKHWEEPLRWNRKAEKAGERRRVFCGSMCDVFESRRVDGLHEARQKLWKLIEETPWLNWLLLTKRPENIAGYVPSDWLENPRENVAYGTTVENQEMADKRIPILLSVPVFKRFVSCEPLLGPVDLRHIHHNGIVEIDALSGKTGIFRPLSQDIETRLDWVITGGESGPKARPSHPDWFRSLRDQCQAAQVPFFFKQWGEWLWVHPDRKPFQFSSPPEKCAVIGETRFFCVGKKVAGRILDGQEWVQFPAY